jgi:SAM-dependent methyltransferase
MGGPSVGRGWCLIRGSRPSISTQRIGDWLAASLRGGMAATNAPIPPVSLAARVGAGEGDTPIEAYLREGAAVRNRIEQVLPDDWTWRGKRVLDFGCGAARVLRQFLDEATEAEFIGCDIDARSVEWIEQNLRPPLKAFCNELAPPLRLAQESIDLVYATSVFTHIGELWSDWLLELHRVLAPGGWLISSYLGEGMWEALIGERYDEDAVGMTIRRHWTAQDAWVFHSEWWLREHWGRLFDVEAVARPRRTPSGAPPVTHSYIALRKRAVMLSKADLEHCNPAEPRELAGLQTNMRLLRQELDSIVDEHANQPLIARAALRRAVLASPLGEPARSLRRRMRRLSSVMLR